MTGGLNQTQIDALKEAFEKIDTDKSGDITKSELKKMIKENNQDITDEVIDDLLNKVDSN